jgi:menaquinone-specific isochorismate synthase
MKYGVYSFGGTAEYSTALDSLESIGILRKSFMYNQDEIVFIRRLHHLQHLCRRIQREITGYAIAHLPLDKLHPTPAVCGYPVKHEAMKFIRENEPFDHGFFLGPFGFFGRNDTDVLVAIRSCLIHQLPSATSVILYAGAGIVLGSTPQAEYIETAHKLSVISSLFPPSPFSLQG